METTIGDKTTFAVSLALDNDCGGAWLYGKFCYWINAQQIGDYEPGTSLRDILRMIKWLAFDNGNRFDENLCTLSKEVILSNLNHLFHSTDNGMINIPIPDSFARFDIKMDVDVFDNWDSIYLIDCHDVSRIILKRKKQHDILEYRIPIGTFDKAILEAYQKIDSLYEIYSK